MIKNIFLFKLLLVFLILPVKGSGVEQVDKICSDAEIEYKLLRSSHSVTNCSPPLKKAADTLSGMIPSLKDVEAISQAAEASYGFYVRSSATTGMTDCSPPLWAAQLRIRKLMESMKDKEQIYSAVNTVKDLGTRYYGDIDQFALRLIRKL